MRKTLLATTITALTVLIAGTSAAQAIVVRDANPSSPTYLDNCPAVSLSGNTVTGGCLIEDMDGTWQVSLGGGTYHGPCYGNFDIRIGGSGAFYAVNQSLSCNSLPRRACKDNVTGETIPWASGGQGANMQMPMCWEFDGSGSYVDMWAPTGWTYSFGSNGQLLSMTQNTAPGNVNAAYFANTGPTNEVWITAN